MLWQTLRERVDSASVSIPGAAAQRPIIHVDSTSQTLRLVSPEEPLELVYPVSTSRFGLGQQKDSFQTPTGIHRICEMIGNGEPLGRVFKSRQPTSQLCRIDNADSQLDVISTRILWLEGLQPGLNQGGDVDSRQRYIYIHGTADEAHIGEPASIGCVRMKNVDVVALFERVQVGDLVVIE